ncbi:MAG: hypothetical protein QM741_09400 [Rudaea sp.]|uniref:hypothetical protein n=1 Tax=Rudaea sp. TaxID=2136325 RepID=UPI0039E45C68
MSEQANMSEQNRVLGRNLAVPLTPKEIDEVSGGDTDPPPFRTGVTGNPDYYTYDAKS